MFAEGGRDYFPCRLTKAPYLVYYIVRPYDKTVVFFWVLIVEPSNIQAKPEQKGANMSRKKVEQTEEPVKATTKKKTGTAKAKSGATSGNKKVGATSKTKKDVVAKPEVDGDVSCEKKPQKVSRAKATFEKVVALEAKLASKGKDLSYRVIAQHMGGSHSTIAKLLYKLESLKKGAIPLDIVVSEATLLAIQEDISRHLELYRDQLVEREELVASVAEDMELLITAFNKLFDIIPD